MNRPPAEGGEIERVDVFADLSQNQRDQLALLTTTWSAEPGEVIFRQGEPADRLLATTAGSIRVSARTVGGGERELGTLPPGSLLGEMALLTAGRRTATAIAIEPCSGVAMTRAAFEVLRLQDNPAALAVVGSVGRVAMGRLRNRYAALAAELEPASPGRAGEGTREVEIELADVAPEAADNRYMKTLMFFRRFSPAEITDVRNGSRTLWLPPDAQIPLGDSLWIVLRGAVEVSLAGARRQRVRLAGPGRCIGHLLFDEEDLPAPPLERRARGRCILLELPHARVRKLLDGEGIGSRRFAEAFHEDVVRALLSAEGAHPPLAPAELDDGQLLRRAA